MNVQERLCSAYKNGELHVAKWLHKSEGIGIQETHYILALTNGHANMLWWMQSLGMRFRSGKCEKYFQHVIEKGHLEVAEWMLYNKFTQTILNKQGLVDKLCNKKDYKMLGFLMRIHELNPGKSLVKSVISYAYENRDLDFLLSLCKKWGNKVAKFLCRKGDLNFLMALHEKEFDVKKNKNKYLKKACTFGHLDCATWLYKLGANIEANDNYCIKTACCRGHLEVAKWLHELGADIRANNDSCIKWACRYGHLEIIKWLYELGADIRANDDECIKRACMGRHYEVIKWLCKFGANIRCTNDWCLENANANQTKDMVKFITKMISET